MTVSEKVIIIFTRNLERSMKVGRISYKEGGLILAMWKILRRIE